MTTPDFHRPAEWEPAMLPPSGDGAWAAMQKMSRDDLRSWGCRPWSLFTTEPRGSRVSHRDAWFFTVDDDEDQSVATHELWLFPAEWYDSIPNGLPIADINGCIEVFEHGKSDDDRRFGMLAYGVMIPYAPADQKE